MTHGIAELDLIELGQRIRRARENLGYSQEAFAAMVGKDQTAISEYENGKRRMFITDLPLFAEKLQMPMAYFFEGEGREDDLDRALLDEFHQLPHDMKSYVIQIVRLLTQAADTLLK